jgi:Skp family chaperone for outer membrane proteins
MSACAAAGPRLSVIPDEENRTVKRKWIVVAVGLAAAAALITAGALWAEQPGAGPAVPARPAAAPRTKIALLNLTYVISYYERYKAYKEDVKQKAEPYEKVIKAKQLEIETLTKEAMNQEHPPTEARRQDIDKQIRQDRFDIDIQQTEAKSKLGKESVDQMIDIYKEVQAAASRYAGSHDFDMVFQYNEPLEQKDYYGAANVERKMSAGALIPLYYPQGCEISLDVLNMLNSSYHPAAAAPAAGKTTPTP